jgi:hypothetical protein
VDTTSNLFVLLFFLFLPLSFSSDLLFWTSYVSVVHRRFIEEDSSYELSLNILLSGSDNRLYSYYVGIEENEQNNVVENETAEERKGNSSSPPKNRPAVVQPKYTLTTCYFGYFEMPGKVTVLLCVFVSSFFLFLFFPRS